MRNEMDCKNFEAELMEIVLTPGATPSVAAAAHLRVCPPCTEEYLSFQSTFSLLDTWQAPEPTAYFDQKLVVLIREEQAAPPMGWVEGFMTRLRLNTGRNFRPALAGALSLALIVGGGSLMMPTTATQPVKASAAVQDLQILDKNEQAFRQMDALQQDDDNSPSPSDATPASEPTT